MNWEELKNEQLQDLVEYVQLRGDREAEEWSQAAFINITFRFRKDLLEKCIAMCHKSGLTETDAEEIANRVFECFFRYPTFKPSKCTVKDIDKCFRFYLYKIARNEFADYIKPDESPYSGEEHIITSLIDPNNEYAPEKLKDLQEAERQLDELFAQLSPKHKIIYLTYLYHEKEGRYLPKELREELKSVLKLTQSTIRVYKKEAFELAKQMGYGN